MTRASNDAMSVTLLCSGIPPSANILHRKHWGFRHKAVKAWERQIYYLTSTRDRAWLFSMRHAGKLMEIDILFRHNSEFDADGLDGACKVVLDALVNNGFLFGDKEKDIKLHSHQEKVRAKETRIRIRRPGGGE